MHRHLVHAFRACSHLEAFPGDRSFDCAHQLLEESAFTYIDRGWATPPQEPGSGLRLDDCSFMRRPSGTRLR